MKNIKWGLLISLITLMLLAACNAKKKTTPKAAIKEKTTAPKKSYPDIESPPEVLLEHGDWVGQSSAKAIAFSPDGKSVVLLGSGSIEDEEEDTKSSSLSSGMQNPENSSKDSGASWARLRAIAFSPAASTWLADLPMVKSQYGTPLQEKWSHHFQVMAAMYQVSLILPTAIRLRLQGPGANQTH